MANKDDRRDKSRKAVKRSSSSKGQPSPAKRTAKLPRTSRASSPKKTPVRAATRQPKKSLAPTQVKKKLKHDKRTSNKKVLGVKGAKKKGTAVLKTKMAASVKGTVRKRTPVTKLKGATIAKAGKKKVKKEEDTKGKKKKVPQHPNSKLTPNLKIQVVDKDPMFEVKNAPKMPKISDHVDCKQAIRAVLTKDNALLKKLIANTKEIPSMFVKRSVCLQDDALDYAIRTGNLEAVKLLDKEEMSHVDRKPMSQALLQPAGTGRYNYRTFGHAVRAINVGRGSREGNNAFTKDSDNYYGAQNPGERFQKHFTLGLSSQMLDLLMDLYSAEGLDVFVDITHEAVRAGHNRLAGELVRKSNIGGGYGFNKLHEEVLLASKPDELTPFRSGSVRKRPYGNGKITPLHCAAINPNPKILDKLLSVVPDFYVRDSTGLSLTHYAAACEGSGPLELLLKRGANANEFQLKTNMTPLMVAAKCGRAQNIEMLIKYLNSASASSSEDIPDKMAVDHKTNKGHFAIHYAAEGGHVDCVRSLIKHGAAVDTMESAINNKITPLMIASERGDFRLAKVLIEELGAEIEKKDKIKRTSLMLACMNGHFPVATLLLRKGANPNAKDSSGNTPVHYAAAYGWWHCLKLLLQAGGDPNTLNDWKVPPLGLAYLKGHLGIADLLLKKPGVDVNFRDENGATLLLTTSETFVDKSILGLLTFLLRKGADVQVVDINGKNALHHIAIRNQQPLQQPGQPDPLQVTLKVVKLLMDNGCDPVQRDKEGNTPLSIAIEKGYFEFVKVFLGEGADVPLDADEAGDNPLHHMAKKPSKSRASILKLVVSKGVSLEVPAKMKDRKGCTPFLRCIINNRGNLSDEHAFATFQALADISDINARVDGGSDTVPNDYADFSALHLLATGVPDSVFSKFVGLKPKLDVLDSKGRTPLILAIDGGRLDNVCTLLLEGADPNASDGNGHFALMMAVCKDLPCIVPELIAKGATIHASLFKNKQPSIMHYIPAYIRDLNAKLRTAKELLVAGASLSTVDDENRTVLHNAVNAVESHVTTEFLEFLLDQKLDVFAVDNFGRLPIHYAFYKYNPFGEHSALHCGQFVNGSHLDPIETVSLLTSAMDDQKLNVQDMYGRTPMHYAAYRGAMISAMHIVERIDDFDVEDEDGHTPLSLAVLNSQQSMAIWLIQRGANINREVKLVGLEDSAEGQSEKELEKENDNGKYWRWNALEAPHAPTVGAQTSVFQAVVYEDWQGAVYVMMDCITRCGISYAEAIEAVLAQQKFQLANELIRKQRNPRSLLEKNSKSQTLLHLLAIHAEGGDLLQGQVAKTLIHRGAKLTAQDYKGCTPFHYAAVNRNAVVCGVFAKEDPIGFKYCLTCADHRDRAPMESLFWSLSHDMNSTKQIIELTRKHNASLNRCAIFPNVSLLSTKQLPRSESLLDWYHNLPDEKTIKVTPLILMILMNNFAGCQMLLKNGADVNYPDSWKGQTPLMHAVLQNEIALVSALLDKNFAEPLGQGIRRTSGVIQQMSPWTTNLWEQKKSGSYCRYVELAIDEGYEVHGDPEECEFPKCKKNTEINVNAVDSQGRTVVHHLMKTCDYGTYKNVELLQLLARVGAKLSEKDHQGKTPLGYAMESGSHKMAAALQKLMRVQPQKQVFPNPAYAVWSDGIDFPAPKPDIDDDAKAMVETLEAERSQTDRIDDFKPTVDKHSKMADSGQVLMDEEQNLGYDVIMTIVESRYGRYGLNNFYRMQLINQLGKNMIVLFTRWGRIGDTGQYQRTPYGTKEEAIQEFKKIFKSKSGNNWADIKNFQKNPKKYLLVEIDPWRAKRNETIKEFQFDLDSPVPSKLSKDMQDVLYELTKPQNLRRALGDTRVDPSIMNFGNFLSKDVLQKAIDILDKLSDMIQTRNSSPSDHATLQASMEKIYELSNEYYHAIPHENFAHDVMEPIVNPDQVREHKSKLYKLLELEMANKILLGATYRKQEMNPLDYIYRALDCKLKLMDKDDVETQHILQFIHQSSNNNPPKVKAIFRLSRDGEEERLKSCHLDNHKLLWHGSSVVNLLSILKKGLQINPAEAERTGQRFGEGIYASDAFAKSVAYCRPWEQSEPSHFMLLCEVALGKMADGQISDEERKNHNSLYAPGRTRIDGKRELCLPSGVSLPLGKLHSNYYPCQSDFNEYVAFTEEQVCLRYLVHVV